MTINKKAPESTGVTISRTLVYINSGSAVIAQVVHVFMMLWVNSFLLSRISPEEFAIYPLVLGLMVFGPVLITLFTSSISRFVIAAYARHDAEEVTKTLSSLAPAIWIATAVLFFIGLVFAQNIDHVLTIGSAQVDEARLMMTLLVTSLCIQVLFTPFALGFEIKQRFVLLNIINIARIAVMAAMLLVLLLGISPRVLWVVVANVTAEMLALAVTVVLSLRMVPELRVKFSEVSFDTVKKVLSFGFWAATEHTAGVMHRAAAPVIVNELGTAVDVTCFHLGSIFDHQILKLTQKAATPLQPALNAMHATGDQERLKNAYMRGGRYAMWIKLFMATPLIIFGAEFIRLYVGETYLQTAMVMALVLSVYPLTAANYLLPRVAVAKGQVRMLALATLATQVISISLMIVFLKNTNYGATGVALAIFVTTMATQLICFLPMGLKLAEVPLKQFISKTVIPGILPAIAAGAVWLTLKAIHPPDSWILLLIFGAIGGLVYVAVWFGFCLDDSEQRDLEKALNMVFSKLKLT